jgi:hypothetical protein
LPLIFFTPVVTRTVIVCGAPPVWRHRQRGSAYADGEITDGLIGAIDT